MWGATTFIQEFLIIGDYLEDENNNTFTVSKESIYGGAIVVLLGLLVLSVFTHGFGLTEPECVCPETEQPAADTQPAGDNDEDVVENTTQEQGNDTVELTVGVGTLPPLGDENAPVTWVQFSEYQCPFCSKLYYEAEASMKENYVDTGKVKLYFRDFPLSFHPHALPAAIAARCADNEGKYWEMHSKLFETQGNWSGMDSVDDVFKGLAVDIGLDNETFNTCYDEAEPIDLIGDDFAEGQGYGVQGTPSSFLIIPKDRISGDSINAAVENLNSAYGGVGLAENEDEYIIFIPGAYPYDAFETILKEVSF
ncbi:thioredoxin domain-containing protein [Candidatus Micrarchaeota archaeon]|nr:thioredoxin domain-containing protein [Candidatus Micrarchaeota archaeon]